MAEPDLLAADAVSAEPEDWRTDRAGRQYTPRQSGVSGIVYRQGEETIADAWARDAKGPPDKRPKKSKVARKPPAPTQIDLKQLEHALTEGLAAPGMMAAMAGDEWAAQHLTTQAPIVARNLVTCAQHNPWLHAQLLRAVTGEGLLMNVMVFMSLGAAVFSYVVPPIIYYLNPTFLPEHGVELIREKYQIPERLEEPGAPPEAPTAAETPAAA